MRPLHARPSRHRLAAAMAMYRPLDRHVPIMVATSTNPDCDQQQLDLQPAEREDVHTHK